MGSPLTPETLVYDLAMASDAQLAPDGRQIVYTLTTTDRASKKASSHLWRCDADGGDQQRLTWAGERNTGARWSPDGRQLAFVSDRVAKNGIFLLPAAGGEPRELTRHAQTIGGLAWSPDGQRLAYTTRFDPENPDEAEAPAGAAPRVRVTRRLDYKADIRGYVGDARQQVFVVEAASGERRRLTSAPADHGSPGWSPDGRWLAAAQASLGGAGSRLALIDAATGDTRLIGPEAGVVALWAWSPAGDRLIIAGDDRRTWQLDFFVYDLADDALRRLTDDLPCLPDAGFPGRVPPSHPVWLDDRRVLFHAIRAGCSGLYTIDVTTGQVGLLVASQAAGAGLSVDAARRLAVQSYSSPTATGELCRHDLQTGDSRVITGHNVATFEAAPPARWERLEVRRGAVAIDAWLLLPPDHAPGRRYPVILDIHGGPNSQYGPSFTSWQQCWATHGFLVVYANPRGSSSYGRHFTQQVIRDWGGEDYRDLLAVVEAVAARPEADPARVGLYGYSYGGYMTAWIIGQTDRFKAAVCGAPCFDLESMWGTSDIGFWFGDMQWGGPPHAEPEWYAAHSPSTHAHRATTPTLIVHGEADERCPIGQGEQMFVALTRAGCEVAFARYPGGSHEGPRFGPPAHTEDFLARTLAWFKHHLGEPAQDD